MSSTELGPGDSADTAHSIQYLYDDLEEQIYYMFCNYIEDIIKE